MRCTMCPHCKGERSDCPDRSKDRLFCRLLAVAVSSTLFCCDGVREVYVNQLPHPLVLLPTQVRLSREGSREVIYACARGRRRRTQTHLLDDCIRRGRTGNIQVACYECRRYVVQIRDALQMFSERVGESALVSQFHLFRRDRWS
jgi:hypothetical protein